MSEQHHHPKLSESASSLALVRAGETRRLFWVLVLTGITMAGEIVGGILTRSLSLLGDAFHMLTHFLAIGLSYAAILIACRPAPPDKTYRYWRVEILAGLVNGLALVPVAGYVLYESWHRLRNPVPIEPVWTLIVGVIGLLANIVCAAILHRHSKHDLNIRAAFVHMVADSASSVGVIVAAGAMWLFRWPLADPIVAALISVLILVWCVGLVRSSVRILLESVPHHMNLEEIRAAMKGVEGVAEVHDLHVWTITSRMYSLTAHVRLTGDVPISEAEKVGHALQRLLDERWEINHVTFQYEVGEGRELHCERADAASCGEAPSSHPHPHGHAH